MRRVRDYSAEGERLSEKRRKIKTRKLEHLGALVTATGADTFDPPMLAGVLLYALKTMDVDQREAWTAEGAAFFQRRPRTVRSKPPRRRSSAFDDPRNDEAR